MTPTEIPTNAAVDSPDFSGSCAGTSTNPVVFGWSDVVDAREVADVRDVAMEVSGGGSTGSDVDVLELSGAASDPETLKEAELARGMFVLEE